MGSNFSNEEMMIDDVHGSIANVNHHAHQKVASSSSNNNKRSTRSGNEDEKNLTSSNIFCFNVGGVKYDVSRATLELHPECMLTKMISKNWNEDETNRTFFIDRDGSRFRYVLDFMRDGGCIHIPITESPAAICQELDYFGFSNVPQDSIVGGVIDQSMLRNIQSNVYDEIDEIESQIVSLDQKKEALENKIGAIKIANIVFIRTAGLDDKKEKLVQFYGDDERNFRKACKAEAFLAERLHAHGLKLVRMGETWTSPGKLWVKGLNVANR